MRNISRSVLFRIMLLLGMIVSLNASVSLNAGVAYHGNVKTKKFHQPSCRYYDCKNCRAVFYSREDAIRAGYVPCKVCRP